MEFIPDNELLLMEIIEPNDGSQSSQSIKLNITVKSFNIYSYVLNELRLKHYHVARILLDNFKQILRCVWGTKCSKSKQPDAKLLNEIAVIKKLDQVCNENSLLLQNITARYTAATRRIEQNQMMTFMYALVPVFDYETDLMDFDEYLYLFKNLLLSANIEKRAQLTARRNADKSNAATQDEIDEIEADYQLVIKTLKDDGVFKIVNYLNYQYKVKGLQENNEEIRDFVWKILLCRYDNVEFNELTPKHRIVVETQIKRFNKENTAESFKLFLLIAIYRFQFIHQDISIYLNDYVRIMVTKLTGHDIAVADYVKSLYSNINDNIDTLLLMEDREKVYKYILETDFKKFSHKVKNAYAVLTSNFPEHSKEIEEIYYKLTTTRTITLLFNTMTDSKYDEVSEKLLHYNFKELIEVFINNCLCSVGIYLGRNIEFLLENFDYDTVNDAIYDAIVGKTQTATAATATTSNSAISAATTATSNEATATSNGKSNNNNNPDMNGLLYVFLYDDRYFNISKNKLQTLEFAAKYVKQILEVDGMKECVIAEIDNFLNGTAVDANGDAIAPIKSYDKHILTEFKENLLNA